LAMAQSGRLVFDITLGEKGTSQIQARHESRKNG